MRSSRSGRGGLDQGLRVAVITHFSPKIIPQDALEVFDPPLAPITSSERLQMNGVIGGGQAGCNWQTGNWLLGLETDIQSSGQRGSGTLDPCVATIAACDAVTLVKTKSEKLTWFGTMRGRIGYATPS